MTNTPDWWSERARKQPTSWDAALWSYAGQEVRFHSVRPLLKIKAGDTVLDFGCGTGGFAALVPLAATYFGYDWSGGMRHRARVEHPSAIILDELDEDQVFDHVVAIGPFNMAANWSKDQTLETLMELWAMHVRRTLVVSLYSGPESEEMLSYSLEDVVDLVWALGKAEGSSSPQTTITNEHLPNDIIFRRHK